MSASNAQTWPAMNCSRITSIASVALRRGRNPYDEAEKSASKMGSSTIFAAA